jgi:hypothetical protein
MHAEGWNNLPLEALTTIFLHLQPSSWQKWQLRPWVALTEVCHLWRQAALNEPALWARVPCCTPKQTEMMLSLSGNNLLDVDASEMWEHDDPYESFALIMAHWRRIRTLRYPIIPAEHSALFAWTLSARLGYPAENLQEVLITCVSKDDFAEDEDDEDEDMDEGEALDDDESGIQPEPTPFGFLPPIPPGDTVTDRLLFFPRVSTYTGSYACIHNYLLTICPMISYGTWIWLELPSRISKYALGFVTCETSLSSAYQRMGKHDGTTSYSAYP